MSPHVATDLEELRQIKVYKGLVGSVVDSRYIPFEWRCANYGPNDCSSEELTVEMTALTETQTNDFVIIIAFAGKCHPR